MINKACYIDVLSTGNTLSPDRFGNIFQIYLLVLKNNFLSYTDESFEDGVSIFIDPEEKILPRVTYFTGFKTKDLEDLKAKKKLLLKCSGLALLSKLCLRLYRYRYRIVGWNLMDRLIKPILDEVGDQADDLFPHIKSRYHLLDVKRFAEEHIPIESVGDLNLETAYLYCFSDIEKYHKLLTKQWKENYLKIKAKKVLGILKSIGLKYRIQSLEKIGRHLEKPRILDRINFGKYKNMKFSEIFEKDPQYLYWLKSSPKILEKDQDLQLTIETILKENMKSDDIPEEKN